MLCAAGAVAPMVQAALTETGDGVTVTPEVPAGERYLLKLE